VIDYVGACLFVAALRAERTSQDLLVSSGLDLPSPAPGWCSACSYPLILLPVRSTLPSPGPGSRGRSAGHGPHPDRTFARWSAPQPGARGRRAARRLYVISGFGAVSIMRFDTITNGSI
jgi:hypothetical protein